MEMALTFDFAKFELILLFSLPLSMSGGRIVHEGVERGPYQYSYEYLVIFQVGSGSLHGQVGGQTDNSSDMFLLFVLF